MLIPLPPIYRPRRRARPRKGAPTPPPPQALTLVAAAFVATPLPARVTLTFDRAIDLAGFVANQVTVRVGATELLYQGTSATAVGPTSARVTLAVAGSGTAAGVRLTATAGTGIVAVDDGGTWAGVTNLALPFP